MASQFSRNFNTTLLPQDRPIWWQDLLNHLQPAGEALGVEGLRLAVRNRYLNFYHKGQAIAKVAFNKKKELYSAQHIKYVFENAKGQHYLRLIGHDPVIVNPEEEGGFSSYMDDETLSSWIARSTKYQSEEKSFIEEVVTANEHVIDMEMGIPETGHRIDLVALEPAHQQARLVFWEAKLTTDSRCRTRQKDTPEVVEQLESYENFLNNKKKVSEIKGAYREACKIQKNITEMAGKSVAPLISDVVSGKLPLTIDSKPRLLLLHNPKKGKPDSWQPHQQKLLELGISLQVMTPSGERRLLSENQINETSVKK